MAAQQDDQHTGDILIVDDKLQNLRLLFDMLSDQGYKVRGAPSGKIALTVARSALPDMVLLDINMPEMDGYEVCQRLKADPITRDIPVLFVSAMGEVFDKVKAFSVGGVDYIAKPFQIEEALTRQQCFTPIARLQSMISVML